MKRDNYSKAQWRKWRATLRRLTWLANCNTPADLQEFIERNPEYDSPNKVTVETRDEVRKLWRGDNADALATSLLIDVPFMRFAVNVRLHFLEKAKMVIQSPAEVKWKLGELVYIPRNGFQTDLYALLKCSHLAKVCGRGKECLSGEPFFIAERSIGKYCSDECIHAARLETWQKNWDSRKKKPKSRKRKGG